MANYLLLGPKRQFFTSSGVLASGYKLYFYTAGSTTLKDTFTDSTGAVANTNPIILNSRGEPGSGVWGSTGAYKIVLKDSADVTIWTEDGVTGINDVQTGGIDEWTASNLTPTFSSATQFTVPGDQTTVVAVGRRIKMSYASGALYGAIVASSYSAPNTTVTMLWDSGSMDSTISSFSVGILRPSNVSIPTAGTTAGQGRCDYVSATQITFAPFNGNRVMVKTNGTWLWRTIPATGVRASNTAAGTPPSYIDGVATNLAANTTYYDYIRDLSGTLTHDFSLTGHATDADTGVEIKSGDATRTLVGMARTDATGQFITRNPGFSGGSKIGLISWFNREPVAATSFDYGALTFATTTMTELSTTKRVEFLSWGSYVLHGLGAVVSNNTAGLVSYIGMFLDGAFSGFSSGGHSSAAGIQTSGTPGSQPGKTTEGWHTAGLGGQVNGGTATVNNPSYIVATVMG